MTKAEMTEIFAVLMLAYPNAEMFRASSKPELMEKLAPTITLWTTCLRDMDFWTAQKAVVKVCETCKFPPTIAEMREAAETILREMAVEIKTAYLMARSAVDIGLAMGANLEEVYRDLPARSMKVIDAMGGMERFAPPDGALYNMTGFEQTYERLLRQNPIGLPGGTGEQAKLT